MHYTTYFLTLAPLALALPQNAPATQTQTASAPWNTDAGFNAVLDPAIQKDWYRDFNATSAGQTSPSTQLINPSHNGVWNPAINNWLTWSNMWELHEPEIKRASKDKLPDSNVLKNAIENQSFKSKVDARLILSLFLNEAAGNVAIGCNKLNGVACGMFQMMGGRKFDNAGATLEEKLNNMIRDMLYGNHIAVGQANGTPGYLDIMSGNKQIFWKNPTKQIWSGNPFGAARFYTGGDAPNYDLTVGNGDKNYVSKFASRLVGWQDPWAPEVN
ncbi:hypothetical protein BDV96DRAFT_650909 [Lophiotrema nucula]|uniref:Transglycosylase SLT domain-containing protein n=1 Tax=Lophiotrema nucula TaxID=690887 RepID=A0A6A5YVV0_9PLEO|nr:hypothetical protein BDV96DRAFT_650909 [Lophiotrema nucula]